jgi:catechol 2,3-dioxygenase-like lactoylglutathione lyase family enzyme
MTRLFRAGWRWVAVLGAWAAPIGGASAQSAPGQTIEAGAVAMVGITVQDLDRSVEFFTRVLGFVREAEAEVAGAEFERLSGVFGSRARVVRLRLGGDAIELTQYLAPEGRPIEPGGRSNDRSFQHLALVVRDMDEAYRLLRRAKVRFGSTGPQTLPTSNPNAGGIRAFYFKDPDGHYLEAIWFPPGKGDPKWQRRHDQPFLGIDHTAIVVGDTEASLRFYRDLLGFAVAGESRNYGTEQEHLNNVEGASLRITGLRLGTGPGVEFLQYLTPTDGRPFPPGTGANDLLHWHTVVRAGTPEAANLLASAGVALLSRGVTTLPDSALGFRRGVMVKDPDGHAVLLIER